MLQVTIAPLWRRFAALAYDSLILLAISMAYGAIVTAIGATIMPPKTQDYQPMFASGSLNELVLLGWLACIIGFYSFFWHKSGQTIGMKAWRLKLVDTTHTNVPVPFIRCLQRCAWGFLSLFILGVGYWYRLFDHEQQCLHDKLTRTHVVTLPKK